VYCIEGGSKRLALPGSRHFDAASDDDSPAVNRAFGGTRDAMKR
jgi:hypothetical protein